MKPSLEKFCRGPVQALRNRALKGNVDAIKDLAALSHHLCTALREVEETNLDCVVSLARNVTEWPMMVGGNHASSRKELERRVKRLQIGKGRDDVHIVAPKEGTSRVADLQSTANKYVDQAEYLIRCAQRGGAPTAEACLTQSQIDRARKIKKKPSQELHEQLVLDVIRTYFCRSDFLANPDLASLGIKANEEYFKKRNLGINTRRAKRESGSVMQQASASTYESQEKVRSMAAAQKKQRGSIEQQLRTAFRYRHGLDSIGGK